MIAISCASPSFAQATDQTSLREELRQAQATMRALQAQISDIEKRLGASETATKDVSVAAAAPSSAVYIPSAEAQHDQPIDGSSNKTSFGLPHALDGQIGTPNTGSFRVLPDGLSTSAEVAAGSGDGRASFTFGQSSTRGNAITKTDQWQVKLSAPLSKGGDDTSVATLDGLATGTTLELSWNRFALPIPDQDPPRAQEIMNRALERCLQANSNDPTKCNAHGTAFKKAYFQGDEEEQYDKYYDMATLAKAIGYGFHTGLGFDRFTYYNSASLAKSKTHRWSWSAGGNLTIFPLLRSSLTFDASYNRSFDAADSKVACPAPAPSPPTLCVSGALAPPDRTDMVILSSEFRTIIPIAKSGLFKWIGLAPKFEYDALSNDVAVNLPIYFVPNDKGQLIGGVQVGYTTKDKTVASVFVGTTFSLGQ